MARNETRFHESTLVLSEELHFREQPGNWISQPMLAARPIHSIQSSPQSSRHIRTVR